MNSYRLTSMEEPTDEMLAQIMREAADIYRKENEEAQKRVEARLRSLTQEYEKEYELEYGMKSKCNQIEFRLHPNTRAHTI